MGVVRSKTTIDNPNLRDPKTEFLRSTIQNLTPRSKLNIDSKGLGLNYTNLIQVEARDNYELFECLDMVSNTERLVKRISKEKLKDYQFTEDNLVTEVEVFRRLDHPNLLKALEICEDESSFYFVFEKTHAIPLSQLIQEKKALPEKKCSKIMFQLLSVLEYCHTNSVVHRDISPRNILILKGKIKLIGFTKSAFIHKYQKSSQILEQNEYSAPELSSGEHNQKCDLYSCGVILLRLLYGDFLEELPAREGNFFKTFDPKSQTTESFIKLLMNTEFRSRVSAFTALTHHFIVKYSQKHYENSNHIFDFSLPKSKNLFRDLIKAHIGLQLLLNGNVEDQREFFNEVNEDNNNSISKDNLARYLRKSMNEVDAKNKTEQFMKAVGSHSLTFECFVQCTVDQRKDFKKQVHELFLYMSDGPNGNVAVETIYRILCKYNKIEDKVWKKALKQHKITMEDELRQAFFMDCIFLE